MDCTQPYHPRKIILKTRAVHRLPFLPGARRSLLYIRRRAHSPGIRLSQIMNLFLQFGLV